MALRDAPVCLIAGAGDVGQRVARLRADCGDDVLTLRRREVGGAPGQRALQADLASGRGLDQLPRQIERVVFCAAPDERGEAAYRALYRDGLLRLLDRIDCPRWLFVSSTAVYGEDAGKWVDETTPANPPQFNGRVLREAEACLAPHPGAVILRCSGLYGPGREAMLRRAREPVAGRPHWTNRLHVDDAAAAISHLLDLPRPQRLYIGSDDQPVREAELLDWLRARMDLPVQGMIAGAETGRRLRNSVLRGSGWKPACPDFRAGYAALTDTARSS
ncbi:MAG TPA: NAD-dependent epimerase/dehydratase family protein [Arenimonas sp.]|nr:NAD-dependent epimerase/dehydratase family protein [Arenimonas sp.]